MFSSIVDLVQEDIAGFEALKISKYGGMLFRGVKGFGATVVSSNVRSWVIGYVYRSGSQHHSRAQMESHLIFIYTQTLRLRCAYVFGSGILFANLDTAG